MVSSVFPGRAESAPGFVNRICLADQSEGTREVDAVEKASLTPRVRRAHLPQAPHRSPGHVPKDQRDGRGVGLPRAPHTSPVSISVLDSNP